MGMKNHKGGKQDDITVIISQIISDNNTRQSSAEKKFPSLYRQKQI